MYMSKIAHCKHVEIFVHIHTPSLWHMSGIVRGRIKLEGTQRKKLFTGWIYLYSIIIVIVSWQI